MTPSVIADNDINEMIAKRAQPLLATANHLPENHVFHGNLTRPLLGNLMLRAVEMEELLDAYGAKNNSMWRNFRHAVATTKLFADVSYELLHILYYLPIYRLISISRDFTEATNKALDFTSGVLKQACGMLLDEAALLSITIPESSIEPEIYSEAPRKGRLPHDIESRKVENVYGTITLLATNFLNLAKECQCLQAAEVPHRNEAFHYTSSHINSENIRRLNQSFHNLQSLYDTYVSYTDVEEKDEKLVVLRGHISVVFHLLKVAKLFAHYYERHLRVQSKDGSRESSELVDAFLLLQNLINYAVAFSSRYICCAEHLCKAMLKRYTQVGEITVSAPVYRGFHVRPSTLVSEIVLHYGTEVRIVLDNETLNAAVPLEIFRINEKINAKKRRYLATRISDMNLACEDIPDEKKTERVQGIILKLVHQGDIVLYEKALEIPDCKCMEKTLLLKQITDIIAQLQAEGKIDIKADIKIKFVGDKRVLNDIQLLADSGYGEDNQGTNIPLPKQLKYLR